MPYNEDIEKNNINDIPEIFCSFVSERKFERCIICDKHLLEEGVQYFIEKAFRDNYVEFEYAMCLECAEKMRDTMSVESRMNVDNYFLTKVDINKRIEETFNRKDLNIEECISNCIFNGTSIDDLDEYQICGHFSGNSIIYSFMPFMMSGEAMEEMQEILSKKTKGEIDDFIDEHFGLPPEWKEIVKRKDIILI